MTLTSTLPLRPLTPQGQFANTAYINREGQHILASNKSLAPSLFHSAYEFLRAVTAAAASQALQVAFPFRTGSVVQATSFTNTSHISSYPKIEPLFTRVRRFWVSLANNPNLHEQHDALGTLLKSKMHVKRNSASLSFLDEFVVHVDEGALFITQNYAAALSHSVKLHRAQVATNETHRLETMQESAAAFKRSTTSRRTVQRRIAFTTNLEVPLSNRWRS